MATAILSPVPLSKSPRMVTAFNIDLPPIMMFCAPGRDAFLQTLFPVSYSTLTPNSCACNYYKLLKCVPSQCSLVFRKKSRSPLRRWPNARVMMLCG
jgi:hypothetical protein